MSAALFTPQATGLSPSRLVRWDALDVLVAVGAAAAAYLAARWLPLPAGLSKSAELLVSSTILNAGFAGAPLLLLALRHRRPVLGTLVPGGRRALDFGWGLELALLVGIINALSVQRLVMSGSLADHPGYYGRAFDAAGPADLTCMLLGWGTLSPICEEIFFRGFVFTALRRHMRAPLAVILSALAFSLIHAPYPEPMAATLILGIVAATVYEYSGSLLPSIMAHLGMNVFFVLFMANHGETARRVPPWLLVLGAAVFAIHFFISSRYLFRKARQN